MKTEVLMIRGLDGNGVRQSSRDKYLSVTDLFKAYQNTSSDTPKQLANYWTMVGTHEFLKALAQKENTEVSELFRKQRGRVNGGTWVHPYIFIDVALWLSPEFKVKVYGWLYDNLIEFRNASGDNFKAMNIALDQSFGIGRQYWVYAEVANRIANVLKMPCTKDRWQSASEKVLKHRHDIQDSIMIAAYMGVGTDVQDCVSVTLSAWVNKMKTMKQLKK